MIKHFLFICLFFVTLYNKVFTQSTDYNFVPLLKEHEKRGEEFYCAYQDSKGFMWFGTDMGIIRYDGRQIRYFTAKDGLPDNTIFGFFEDEKERLWGRTFNGKLFYIKDNKVFSDKFLNEKLKQLIGNKEILNLCVVNASIYLGLYESPPVKIQFYPHLKMNFLPVEPNTLYIHCIDDKNFVYGTSSHIPIHNIQWTKNKVTNNYILDYSINILNSSRVLQLNNSMLLLAENRTVLIENEGIRFIQKNKGNVTCAFYEGKYVYIGYENDGLYMYSLLENELLTLEHLQKKTTPNVLIDKEKNMWVVDKINGIYYLPHYKFKVLNINNNPKNLNDNDVVFIKKYNTHSLFFGLKNKKTGFIKKGNIEYLKKDFGDDYVCLSIDTNELWLAEKKYFLDTSNEQLIRSQLLIIKNEEITKLPYENFGIVKAMVYQKETNTAFIAEHNKISTVKQRNNCEIDTLFKGRFNSVALLDKELFYSTLNGLFAADINSIKKPHRSIISSERINKLLTIEDKAIVASTHGLGLYIIFKNEIIKINADDGLINDLINCFYYDTKKKNLWVGTPTGISRIIFLSEDFKKYDIQNFDLGSGLASNIVNDIELISDTLYVAGTKGITLIPIGNLPAKIQAPNIFVNAIYVNKAPIDVANFNGMLSYKQREIEFHFDAISYSFSSNIHFLYRMLPGDSVWKSTFEHKLNFENLSYGIHTFELMACTLDNSSCSDIYTLNFNIEYPFWYKWWFYVAVVIILFGMVYYIISLRVKRIRSKVELKKKLLDAEKKALRAQMNPHFIFNALASIQKFVLVHDAEKADYYIERFSSLIRLVLETSKEVNINLMKEISLLKLYLELEQLRLDNKFKYEINVNKNVEPYRTYIPSMLIQPLIENAIWHGIAHLKHKNGYILISFSIENDMVKCIIEDNGVGRVQSEKYKIKNNFHSSYGFDITKQRIELRNKAKSIISINDIYDDKGKPKGTRVELFI